MSTVNEAVPTTSTTATDLASYQQFALEQQAQNNAWSAEQAQKQMDFQREMSNTAHQREVADLKAAGLNPILSVNSGASVPNGAIGQTDTSAAGNVGGILQQVLSAQSAREVAGMYNAATIAAATIAANASMYGSDMTYWNKEDHPGSIEEVMARLLLGGIGGSDHSPGTGSSPHDSEKGASSGSSGSSGSSSGSAVGIANNASNQILERLKSLIDDRKNTFMLNSSSVARWISTGNASGTGLQSFSRFFNSASSRLKFIRFYQYRFGNKITLSNLIKAYRIYLQ